MNKLKYMYLICDLLMVSKIIWNVSWIWVTFLPIFSIGTNIPNFDFQIAYYVFFGAISALLFSLWKILPSNGRKLKFATNLKHFLGLDVGTPQTVFESFFATIGMGIILSSALIHVSQLFGGAPIVVLILSLLFGVFLIIRTLYVAFK